MQVDITPTIFEWLLAQWAGFEQNPAAVFPSLSDVNSDELANQLARVLDRCGPRQTPPAKHLSLV